MRYILLGILGVMVLIAFFALLRDHERFRQQMKSLPDSGYIGEMVVLQTGKSYPLPREGLIGGSGRCDVRVRIKGKRVRGVLASFRFVEKKGLRLAARRNVRASLDGGTIAKGVYALHGSVVRLNGIELKVRLFEGVNAPVKSRFIEGSETVSGDEYYLPPDDPFMAEQYAPLYEQNPMIDQPAYVPKHGQRPADPPESGQNPAENE